MARYEIIYYFGFPLWILCAPKRTLYWILRPKLIEKVLHTNLVVRLTRLSCYPGGSAQVLNANVIVMPNDGGDLVAAFIVVLEIKINSLSTSLSSTSATRCLEYLYNIWPFTTTKICQKPNKILQSKFKFSQLLN